MNSLISTASLGSIYAMISICFIVFYSYSKFFNIAIVGFVSLAPHMVAELSSGSTLSFILAVFVVIVFMSTLSYLIDRYLYYPLSKQSANSKIITSVAVLAIILTLIAAKWPSGIEIENPVLNKELSLLSSNVAYIDILTIISGLILLVSFTYISKKTTIGREIKAFSQDPNIAHIHGISHHIVGIYVSVLIGICSVVSGVLLVNGNDIRSGTTSAAFFAVVSISVYMISYGRKINKMIIGAFVIAFAQTFASTHIMKVNNWLHDLLDIVGLKSTITIGTTFAYYFVPFFIALVFISVVPVKQTEERS